MAINLVSVKCPDCGAQLSIEEGRNEAFCTYCGAKVLINNENEHIHRYIDEAGIKQAETDRVVRMRQMEIADEKRIASQKTATVKLIISLVLAVIGVLMMVVGGLAGSASGDPDSGFYIVLIVGMFLLIGSVGTWHSSRNQDDDDDFGDKIKVPSAIEGYEKKNYTAIEAILKGAGFTNIQSIALNDLTIGVIKKPGLVESISINGRSVTYGGTKFSKDAPIIISYHSFR